MLLEILSIYTVTVKIYSTALAVAAGRPISFAARADVLSGATTSNAIKSPAISNDPFRLQALYGHRIRPQLGRSQRATVRRARLSQGGRQHSAHGDDPGRLRRDHCSRRRAGGDIAARVDDGVCRRHPAFRNGIGTVFPGSPGPVGSHTVRIHATRPARAPLPACGPELCQLCVQGRRQSGRLRLRLHEGNTGEPCERLFEADGCGDL